MSSQRTPALVMTMVLDRGHVTPTEWLTRARVTYNGPCPTVHGKPSNEALAARVKAWEDATKPGGVNAHIGETKVLSAKIVRQSTQEVLAQYDGFKFVYADLDEETGLYCVFNHAGKVLSSHSSPEEAGEMARKFNKGES